MKRKIFTNEDVKNVSEDVKDILITFLTVVLVLGLVVVVTLGIIFSISRLQPQTEPKTFTVIERTHNWQVVYNNDTKVMYVVSDSSENRGVFTLLVNPDGSPMIYDDNVDCEAENESN